MEYKIEYKINEDLIAYYLNKDEITVGRSTGNDIQLLDKEVSKHHCKLVRWEGSFQLIDLNSSNGCCVNGRKVRKIKLAQGDIITVGRTLLKFLPAQKEESFNDIDGQQTFMVTTPLDVSRTLEGEWGLIPSLANLGKNLITSENISACFQKVGDFIYDFIEPEKIYLFHYDEIQENLYAKYFRSKKREEDQTVKISNTIALKAMRERVAILSSNTRGDLRFKDSKSLILYGITSVVAVPIWTKDAIYGLVYLHTTDSSKIFNEKDLGILSLIANFAGLSIEAFNGLEKFNRERRLRTRFERYHSPGMVSRLIGFQGDETGMSIPYRETEASVLFVDIVGFTQKAEIMTPIEVGIFLNDFFTRMTEIIFKHQGTLDKYIGDAIMAIFGIPFELDNHSELAVNSALEMLEKLEEMNHLLPEKNKIQVRIGIHSGILISGDFGSPKRLDYTVLGNTVNIASRLESSVAGPNEVVVSEAVYNATSDYFVFEGIGERRLLGISKPVNTYKVIRRIKGG